MKEKRVATAVIAAVTIVIDGLEYKFVEECLLEDRANLINDKLGEDGNLTKVVKTELGWAVYSRPKDLKSKFFPLGGASQRKRVKYRKSVGK